MSSSRERLAGQVSVLHPVSAATSRLNEDPVSRLKTQRFQVEHTKARRRNGTQCDRARRKNRKCLSMR